MANAGDSMGGRFKASVTRSLRKGLAPRGGKPKVVAPRAEVDSATTIAAPAAPSPKPPSSMYKKAQKSRTFRFVGSMRYGGPIHKTGLYLMHKGEHVKSPYKKGG